ncbi:MAG: hypothetical protein LBS72_05440 [Oscillospiraceae bacterium]|jgi:hypothetical protein|nr:hypothetical protein [Oscillospiraceae bacterium]
MTSREIIRRIVRHDNPPRLGWDFHDPRYQDILHVHAVELVRPGTERYEKWGAYPELNERIPNFNGELCMDKYGNILGRLNGITKGECVRGAIQEDWSEFEEYKFPEISEERLRQVVAMNLRAQDKYVMVYLPGIFSVLRDMRRMDNALMDVAAEPEQIENFLVRLMPLLIRAVEVAAEAGADGVMNGDDWGMQTAPFISPNSFRELFKPAYREVADACRKHNIDYFLHSCGFVLPLVDDMIDAGVRVFQFDQPEMAGVKLWAERYADRVAFHSPVDIQKIMPTGDRAVIEAAALHMAESFRKAGGGLIAKDYPTWFEIEVKDEWASWARDVIVSHSDI